MWKIGVQGHLQISRYLYSGTDRINLQSWQCLHHVYEFFAVDFGFFPSDVYTQKKNYVSYILACD